MVSILFDFHVRVRKGISAKVGIDREQETNEFLDCHSCVLLSVNSLLMHWELVLIDLGSRWEGGA
jgi:hypothetical protein